MPRVACTPEGEPISKRKVSIKGIKGRIPASVTLSRSQPSG
jgi:hypothetical protein